MTQRATRPVSVVARPPQAGRRAVRKPYWTVAPAVFCLLVLSVYPVIHLVWLSLHNPTIVPGAAAKFIGLTQYRWILQDAEFLNSIQVTARFVVSAALLELALGLGLALLLNFEGRLAGLLRMLFLLPTFLAPVVVALSWVLLLNAQFGLVNYLLDIVGIDKQAWLARPDLAFGALVAADVWQWTPFMMLLILAGLRSLPVEPYEAAAIDGASAWRAFWSITVPLVWPVMAVALLIRALDATKVFGLALVLTGGGPGDATNVLGLYIFRKAFEQNQLEYASGVAVLLFLITVTVATFYSVFLLRSRIGR
ncbi:MAG: carbohydrate ABC transporter permease [Chloroflexota bacterium]